MNTTLRFILCTAFAILLFAFDTSSSLYAQPSVHTREIATGLEVPWEIQWGPDGWIWFTERRSRIFRLNPETGEKHLLTVIQENFEWTESGLLGLVLHPAFPDSPYVYTVYTRLTDSGLVERVVRFNYDVDSTGHDSLISPWILLDSIPAAPSHNGSRLAILGDMTMLITTGERADHQIDAQDQTKINGKILRIALDGSVPPDNPWAGDPWPSSLIYTKGHRNPQGLWPASNGIIYSSEHGSTIDDEVNLIKAGGNYGWWPVEGFCDGIPSPGEQQFCIDSNVTEPMISWTPTIAPTGIQYYDHTAIALWRNSLILTSLKSGLFHLKLNPAGDSIIEVNRYLIDTNGLSTIGRLRDLCISPDGRVFVSTSNRDQIGPPRPGDDRIVQLLFIPASTPIDAPHGMASAAPNPFATRTTVNAGRVMGPGLVRIYDTRGRIARIDHITGGTDITIERGNLAAGRYYVEFVDAQGIVRCEIVVKP